MTAGRRNQVELAITGMTCVSCANRLERKLDGVTATVNYATEKAQVSYAQGVEPQDLVSQKVAASYTAALRAPPVADNAPEAPPEPDPARALRTRPPVSLALAAFGWSLYALFLGTAGLPGMTHPFELTIAPSAGAGNIYAAVLRDGREVRIPTGQLVLDDRFVVRPARRSPPMGWSRTALRPSTP